MTSRVLLKGHAPIIERESDLVSECTQVAESMGAMLAVVGQRRAKGSGTTIGFPDLVLICAGHVVLIETKRAESPDTPRGTLNMGQQWFIGEAAAQGVTVYVIDNVDDFVALVNMCRREAVV